MEYFFTWLMYYLAAITLLGLCVYPLRRHRVLVTFVAGMGILLCLVPWEYDDSFSAPLFIVMLFQLFLEQDNDIADVMTMFVFGTCGVILICAVLYVSMKFQSLWSYIHARIEKTRFQKIRL